MKPEDDPQLWNLLGKSPAPEVPPFFARNVLRKIRQRPAFRDYARKWLLVGKLVPVAGVVAIILLCTVLKRPVSPTQNLGGNSAQLSAQTDGTDDDLLLDLDDLVAADDTSAADDVAIL